MKDPAVLLYIDKWISATRGMRGAEKGWYLDLLLCQYDKGFIPNNFDELCSICSIRPSEYNKFEQVFEQVLKQKFKQDDEGNLKNEFASEVLQRRQSFIEKRSLSGKISYMVRFVRKNFKVKKEVIEWLKTSIDFDEIDIKDEHVFKQMIEQKIELYINEDINIDFYSNELNNNSNEKNIKIYKAFVDLLKGDNPIKRPLSKVLKMNDQISYERFMELLFLSREHGTSIKDTTLAIENHKNTYKSFNLTLTNWLKRN